VAQSRALGTSLPRLKHHMRAAVLTSTSLRHRFFAQTIASAFDLPVVLCQAKKNYYDDTRRDSLLVQKHFVCLAEAEEAEFAPRVSTEVHGVMKSVEDINDPALVDNAKKSDVDVVFLFGTAILRRVWLDAFPQRIINLHLGLSPFYRGSATLFWPFVNGELECVGATVHLATNKVDAGEILGRVKADPQIGDSYYSLTTRLIRRAIELVPKIGAAYLAGALEPLAQAADETHAYRKADFTEAALAKALAFIGDGLTAEQIEAAERSGKCVCSR
jgi:methionyl-tRNA formyltransferase